MSSLKVQKSKSMGNFLQSPTENGHSASDTLAINDNMDEMVQNVVYALTGIEGKYFVKDVPGGGLKVNPKIRIRVRDFAMLSRLGEAAYYLERIVAFTDSSSGESPLGLLGQGLVTAIKQELTNYYAMVAMFQEQVCIIALGSAGQYRQIVVVVIFNGIGSIDYNNMGGRNFPFAD